MLEKMMINLINHENLWALANPNTFGTIHIPHIPMDCHGSHLADRCLARMFCKPRFAEKQGVPVQGSKFRNNNIQQWLWHLRSICGIFVKYLWSICEVYDNMCSMSPFLPWICEIPLTAQKLGDTIQGGGSWCEGEGMTLATCHAQRRGLWMAPHWNTLKGRRILMQIILTMTSSNKEATIEAATTTIVIIVIVMVKLNCG